MPSQYSVVFCTRVAWVCLLLCKEEGSSPVSLKLLRGGIWACMRCPCICIFFGFRIGTMLANFHMYGINIGVKSGFNLLVRRPVCVRCLMFSLSGPCYFYFVVLPLGH